jgi:hypothetical protein
LLRFVQDATRITRFRQLKRFPDDRGSSPRYCVSEWDDVVKDRSGSANYSVSHPGSSGHGTGTRGAGRPLPLSVRGSSDMRIRYASGELDEVVSSGDSLQLVRIPGSFWHASRRGSAPAHSYTSPTGATTRRARRAAAPVGTTRRSFRSPSPSGRTNPRCGKPREPGTTSRSGSADGGQQCTNSSPASSAS